MAKIMNIEMEAGKRAQTIVGRIFNALTEGTIDAKVREDGICEATVKFGNEGEFEKVLDFMKRAKKTKVTIVQ